MIWDGLKNSMNGKRSVMYRPALEFILVFIIALLAPGFAYGLQNMPFSNSATSKGGIEGASKVQRDSSVMRFSRTLSHASEVKRIVSSQDKEGLSSRSNTEPQAQQEPVAVKFGVYEQELLQAGTYSNPYRHVKADVELTSPTGIKKNIPMFWDGGRSWKFRFSPDEMGTWNWKCTSNDAGLNGKRGAFVVGSSSNHGGIIQHPDYPHHMTYQDGTPFWWVGDTAWKLFADIPDENHDKNTVKKYIDSRARQGFNVVHSVLSIDHAWESNQNDKVNPEYWREVDRRVAYLNKKGITAGLVLAWGKDNSPELFWRDWESFESHADRLRYALYAVGRYAAYNVYFVISGEFEEADSVDFDALGLAIAQNDPHHRMIGIHAVKSARKFADRPWMSFADYQQNKKDAYQFVLQARDHKKPVINAENTYYLHDRNQDGVVDSIFNKIPDARYLTYDIVMAGGDFVTGFAATYIGGLRYPATFDGMDSPKYDVWEETISHVKKFFTRLEWWKLSPNDLLVSGPGTNHVLCEEGQTYVVYSRGSAEQIRLRLNGMSGKFSVQRYNPRTGQYTPLSDVSAKGTIGLRSPDTQDWIFLIKRIGVQAEYGHG
jgi:hypothetical protein